MYAFSTPDGWTVVTVSDNLGANVSQISLRDTNLGVSKKSERLLVVTLFLVLLNFNE